MRTTRDENAQLGKIMAEKLNRAKGPTTVVIPRKGVSAIDNEGQPFYDAEADSAFVESLKSNLRAKAILLERGYITFRLSMLLVNQYLLASFS